MRFPLIVGVVFIHAYGLPYGIAGNRSGIIAPLVQDYISQILARICVPLFYLIGGYLFFFNFSGSLRDYFKKLKSRTRSLLIPFLFWNILTIIFFWILPKISGWSAYLSGHYPLISSYNAFDFLDAVFGISGDPIAYQFWFIRDLMILVALSPVIFFFIQRWPTLGMGVLGGVWVFNFYPINPMFLEGAFFFTLGGALSRHKFQWDKFERFGKIGFLFYLAVSLLDLATRKKWFNSYIHDLGLLTGVFSAFWLGGFPVRVNWLENAFRKLSSAGFFVFAAHEPFLTAVKKITYLWVNPINDFGVVLWYILNPGLVIVICASLYFVVRRIAPRFTMLICGGRV